MLAARHNPALLDEYVAVEQRIGHRFRVDVSMAEVREEADSDALVGSLGGAWNM